MDVKSTAQLGTRDRPVIIGTRGSQLARTQTEAVACDLRERGLQVEVMLIKTTGDLNSASLSSLGGTGAFAAELRVALLQGRCDLAVHSCKDLPVVEVPDLTLAAIPPRAPSGDVLCAAEGKSLADLPAGARVGTGSPRRAAQLKAARPDLVIVDIRGNVPTRLARVKGMVEGEDGDLDAVVLAQAGLLRLGQTPAITAELSPDPLLPAPAQGALAIEARTCDITGSLSRSPLAATLRYLDDLPTRLAVTSERAVLRYLEAGCAAPIGALADLDWDQPNASGTNTGTLRLRARVTASDGQKQVAILAETVVPLSVDAQGRDYALSAAEELGMAVGEQLIAEGAGQVADLRAVKEPGQSASALDQSALWAPDTSAPTQADNIAPDDER